MSEVNRVRQRRFSVQLSNDKRQKDNAFSKCLSIFRYPQLLTAKYSQVLSLLASTMHLFYFSSTEFLHKMLNASYSQLNSMFTRTYGLHYNQNSQLFVDFYSRMHKYLEGKEDNVTQIVDALFTDMGTKMISMLHIKDRMANANAYQWRYPITSVVSCLVKNFHGSQAYGTGPDTLKKNLIRSLTAGRSLAMVLAVQRETLASVMKKVRDKIFHAVLPTQAHGH